MGTSTNCSAVCTTGTRRLRERRGEDEILGTSIEVPERFHQLVPTLRHWSIEDLHEGARLDPVLHGVPHQPHLWRRVRDRPWPRSAGLVLVEAEEHQLGSGGPQVFAV